MYFNIASYRIIINQILPTPPEIGQSSNIDKVLLS